MPQDKYRSNSIGKPMKFFAFQARATGRTNAHCSRSVRNALSVPIPQPRRSRGIGVSREFSLFAARIQPKYAAGMISKQSYSQKNPRRKNKILMDSSAEAVSPINRRKSAKMLGR
jgi:hypothetical protein